MTTLCNARAAQSTNSSACQLVIDLAGDGFNVTALTGPGAAPVYFDQENKGFAHATAWVAPADGLLFFDRNHNGKIDNHSEVFDSFTALTALDGNHDGHLTAADSDFQNLGIWQDSNQDGYSQADEQQPLVQQGVTDVMLLPTPVNYQIAGNTVVAESTLTINNTLHKIAAICFPYDRVNSEYRGDFTLNLTALLLPQLRGYGNLPDLTIAISRNPALAKLLMQLTQLDIGATPEQVAPLVERILYSWAGSTTGILHTDTDAIDVRHIAFLEKMFDKPAAADTHGYIGPQRGAVLEKVYTDLNSHLGATLLWQSSGRVFFITAPSFNALTDRYSGNYQLDFPVIKNALHNKTPEQTLLLWSLIFSMIDASNGADKIEAYNKVLLADAITKSGPWHLFTYKLVMQNYHQVAARGLPAAIAVVAQAKHDRFIKYLSYALGLIVLAVGGSFLFIRHYREQQRILRLIQAQQSKTKPF